MFAKHGEIEHRAAGEIRMDPSGDRKLRGYAITFNSLSQMLGSKRDGQFRERIVPEAIDRTLSEALDVRALIDHDASKIIGRTRAGTLALRKDGRGLRVEIDPPNTTAARDILESVARGDVSGMSFSFSVLGEDESWWHMEDGVPTREVRDMRVSEVSIVSFPAYPSTDVQVASRSMRAFLEKQGTSIAMLRKMHATLLTR